MRTGNIVNLFQNSRDGELTILETSKSLHLITNVERYVSSVEGIHRSKNLSKIIR